MTRTSQSRQIISRFLFLHRLNVYIYYNLTYKRIVKVNQKQMQIFKIRFKVETCIFKRPDDNRRVLLHCLLCTPYNASVCEKGDQPVFD